MVKTIIDSKTVKYSCLKKQDKIKKQKQEVEENECNQFKRS